MKDYIKMLNETIDTGEPVFMVRAKDVLSITILKKYFIEARARGCDQDFLDDLEKRIEEFENWRVLKQNRTRIKLPD